MAKYSIQVHINEPRSLTREKIGHFSGRYKEQLWSVLKVWGSMRPRSLTQPLPFLVFLTGVRLRGTLGDIDPHNKVPFKTAGRNQSPSPNFQNDTYRRAGSQKNLKA